jgi:hypothetical protein
MKIYVKSSLATEDNRVRSRKEAIYMQDNEENGLDTHTLILLNTYCFHSHNGYSNAPQCYVVRPLPVLFNFVF